MAEYTAVAIQTVAAGESVLFTDSVRLGKCCNKRNIFHRPDTGTVRVRGESDKCFTRARVFFTANIAIPEGGTVGEISVGISVDGEVRPSTIARFVPAAVEEYGNVTAFLYVDIPEWCCLPIRIVNTSPEPILVQNANMTVTKA